MNNIIKPGVVLLVICIIASAILGYVNAITAEPIAKADAETKNEKKNEAYETTWGDENTVSDPVSIDGKDITITGWTPSQDGKAYAISTESNGFSAGLKLMFAVGDDGKILGMSVVDCSNETPGLGANIKTEDYRFMRDEFKGKDISNGNIKVKKDGGDIDAITGATITSRAAANAANGALTYFNDKIKNSAASTSSTEKDPVMPEENSEAVSEDESKGDKEVVSEDESKGDKEVVSEDKSKDIEEVVSEDESKDIEEVVSEDESKDNEETVSESESESGEESVSESENDEEKGGADNESDKNN